MIIQLLDAKRIGVASYDDGRRPPDIPPYPLIVLAFPPPIVYNLVTTILRPYAKSEHVIAGYYRHRDGKMTLGCYLVVPIAERPPIMHVIGNEIDLNETAWKRFNERRKEFGCYGVSVGPETDIPSKVALAWPRWIVKVKEFYLQDIQPLIGEKILPSDPRHS